MSLPAGHSALAANNSSLLSVEWTPRSIPLTPVAVMAEDDAARTLAVRLLRQLESDSDTPLAGVVSGELLLLIGEPDRLPWTDGARYLGRAEGAPSLLLPTNLQPSMAESMLESAVRRAFPAVAPPVAVLPFGPGPVRLMSAAAALPVNADRLSRWLRAEPL